MGYRTNHTLEIQQGSNDLIQELRECCEEASYAIQPNGDTGEECKWYRHEDDMKAFSLKHPEALFKISGEGEESLDLWCEYYKNGKVQVCKAIITFPQFNSDLLE